MAARADCERKANLRCGTFLQSTRSFFWMMNDDGKTCVKLLITAIATDVAQYATSYCFEADCAVVLHHIHHSTRRVPAGPKPPRCLLLNRRSHDDSIVGRPTMVCGGRENFCRLEHLFPPVVHDFLRPVDYYVQTTSYR